MEVIVEVTVRRYGETPPVWDRAELWREVKGEGEEEIAVLSNGSGRKCRVVLLDGKDVRIVR
jgi:hypothetical protein